MISDCSPLRDLMERRGWTAGPDGTYERANREAFAVCVERLDGSLSVFAADRNGGGSLAIPSGTPPEEMARLATEFAA